MIYSIYERRLLNEKGFFLFLFCPDDCGDLSFVFAADSCERSYFNGLKVSRANSLLLRPKNQNAERVVKLHGYALHLRVFSLKTPCFCGILISPTRPDG